VLTLNDADSTRQNMSSPQQVWHTYINAWNGHDIDAILDSVTDDFIYDERPMTMDHPLQGRPAFRAYLERTFGAFPDLTIELTSCDAGSALAVSESVMRGTHLGKLNGLPATRRRITARVACVFEVRNGKLAHERLYWDRANTLRQLGRFAAIMAVVLQPPVSEAALFAAISVNRGDQPRASGITSSGGEVFYRAENVAVGKMSIDRRNP
jgi:carboxymethylenebutenolidase